MPWRIPVPSKPVPNDTSLLLPIALTGGVALLLLLAGTSTLSSSTRSTDSQARPSLLKRIYPPNDTSTPASTASSAPDPPNEPDPPSAADQPSTLAFQIPTFSAAQHYKDGKYHLLLCATGSVAAIKIPAICGALSAYSNLSIRILLSDAATRFLQGQSEEQPHWGTLKDIRNVNGVYVDRHEWHKPWKRGHDILHIELRRWADLMVIAPLSANGLAKMALGMSDNLIMSVVRAWDTTGQIDGVRPGVVLGGEGGRKTIMVAPAMNTAMWRHPVTMKHLNVLTEEWGVSKGGWIELLAPIEKGLACGDVGSGGMKDWKAIVNDIECKFAQLKKDAAPAEGGE